MYIKYVMVLRDYNFERMQFLSLGKKNYKVKDCQGNDVYVSPEKVAQLDELVCVVWQEWSGTNGRGSHRIERVLYPDKRIRADCVGRQYGEGRINEKENPSP